MRHQPIPVRTYAIDPPVIVCDCGRYLERTDEHYWRHVDTDPTLSEDVPGTPDYDDMYGESLVDLAEQLRLLPFVESVEVLDPTHTEVTR